MSELVQKVCDAIAEHLDGGTVSYPLASRAAIKAVAEHLCDPYMQSLTSPVRPMLDKLVDGLMPVLHEFTPDRSGMIATKVADALRSALLAQLKDAGHE
jgi:bifunctional pyridoxal-dependent enzyme with beta-cystathionase and maltose regulon repressor activities